MKSDWQGATSYATTDTDFVLRGLDAKVLSILKSALTGIGEKVNIPTPPPENQVSVHGRPTHPS